MSPSGPTEMTTILNREWHGVLALIILLCGIAVAWVIDSFVDPLFRGYLFGLWMCFGWLGPSLLLSISGLRHGNLIGRICGGVVLLALVVPVVFIVWVGHELTGR
jgi:hypothetical protein